MAVKYSGAAASATFVGDSRAAIANGLKDALLACGWSVVSGSSGDWKLQSGQTPAGHAMRLRVWDPGSGNCAQVRIMSVDETIQPAGSIFLLPLTGRVFRVLGCPYQAFVFVPGTIAARSFLAVGVPWVPTFVSVSRAAWAHGNAQSDADTVDRHSFRSSDVGPHADSGCQATIWGSSGWYSTGFGAGEQTIANVLVSGSGGAIDRANEWADGSLPVWEPLMGFGAANINDTNRIRGQLWDTILIRGNLPLDQIVSWDGRQWWCVYYPRGGRVVTLAVLYPTT